MADERCEAAAAALKETVPDFDVVAAVRIADSDDVLLRLTADHVASAVRRLRQRFPLWTCTAVRSEAHSRELINVLVPTESEGQARAREAAVATGSAVLLRRATVVLLLAAVAAPLLQITHALRD